MKKTFNIVIYIFATIGFVLIAAYIAIKLGWTKTSGIVDSQHDYFQNQASNARLHGQETQAWESSEEWAALKEAVAKDKDQIVKAGKEADIQPRLIVAALIVEQLRLFYSERELFKTVFEPLKILGTQSQFSWGVMGIKQDTAKQIEANLADPRSPWYPGQKYQHILDFSSSTMAADGSKDIDSERFARLTNQDDRSYSYLYAALYMKEIEAQWQKAGFPIADRPDIVATLFNIGFDNSHPNANPQAGGAEIDIGSTTYSFGSLAGSFYASNELIDEFPR